ncbi:MAG: CPBP family intramembrane metalloprotease [Planctomycetes bacterium]|nr:CPBP family intramembrane metalloprotease [Planctomycetota bacterium]
MTRNVRVIFRKELRVTLRDKRTLFVMLVLPVLLYPLLLIGFSRISARQMGKLQKQSFTIAITGAEFSPGLAAQIKGCEKLKLTAPKDPEQDLKSGALQLWVEVGKNFGEQIAAGVKGRLTIHYNGAKDRSRMALRKLNRVIASYSEGILKQRLAARSVDESLLNALSINVKNVAPPRKMAGFFLGPMLAVLLVVMSMTGAFYPALDLCAGEKERGTIETLLVSPAERVDIVTGKFLTILLISIVTTLLNLASMCITFAQVGNVMMPKEFGAAFAISIDRVGICLLALLPTAALFSAVSLAISSMARSYREGQHYLTPVMFVALPLAMVVMVPNFDPPLYYSLVPVTNASVLLKKLFVGEYDGRFIAGVFFSTTVYAAAALHWAAQLYNREDVIFRTPVEVGWRPQQSHRRRLPRTGDAAFLFCLCLALFVLVGPLFMSVGKTDTLTAEQVKRVQFGILCQQIFLFLLPAILYSALMGFDPRKTFRLKRPALRDLGLSVLIGLTSFVLLTAFAYLQINLFEGMKERLQQSEEFMQRLVSGRLSVVLFLFAMVPAVCEETVFRGLMLTGFSRRSRRTGILLTGILFAMVHGIRGFCIFPLGFVLAYVVLRTGSLFNGMAIHFTHNATGLVTAFIFQKGKLAETIKLAPPRLGIADVGLILGAALVFAASVCLLSSAPAERAEHR